MTTTEQHHQGPQECQRQRRRRRLSALAVVSAAVAASVLCYYRASSSSPSAPSSPSSAAIDYDSVRRSLRAADAGADARREHPRQRGNRKLASLNLSQFTDPKSVSVRSDAPPARPVAGGREDARDNAAMAGEMARLGGQQDHFTPIDHNSRNNCQIVYIMGVEGATHHGFMPILENLAAHQVDPVTNQPYSVDIEPMALKAGLFGWFYHSRIKKWGFKITPEVDDDEFVRRVVKESCPDDGRKHILLEWASFPSGQEDDKRSYRVHRQHEWLTMGPEEIANTEEALSHPTSMNAFYKAYSPYVDIKFIVLHRPFLETIASHRDWDGGPAVHSNIIRGFMLMLRRFLDMHVFDLVTGSRLWSLVCVEKIMAKNYGSEGEAAEARGNVMRNLANFLGWPNGECGHCFDDWRESTKDPLEVLGEENVEVLRGHMEWLEGVWPPPGEPGVAEQQCGI